MVRQTDSQLCHCLATGLLNDWFINGTKQIHSRGSATSLFAKLLPASETVRQTNNITQCTFKNPARVSLLLGDQCEFGFCEPEFEEGSRLQNPGQQTKEWERAEAGSRVRIGKESYGTKHRDSKWIVAGLTKQESGSWSTASKHDEWLNKSMQRPQNCGRKICVSENFSSPGISAQRTSLSLQVWKESAKKSLCNCVHARISRLWATWNSLNHCHCTTCNPNLLCFGVGIKKQLSGPETVFPLTATRGRL